MTGLWQWLYDASLSKTLRDSAWAFPIIECIHIYSMVSLIALFAGFDMRLMGFAMGGRNRRPIPELATTVLHWVWIPIAINTITGLLMFAPNALTYSANPAFRAKMLIILVGLLYHLPLLFKAARWNNNFEPSNGIKVLSVVSFTVWLGVIVASRWIAYT